MKSDPLPEFQAVVGIFTADFKQRLGLCRQNGKERVSSKAYKPHSLLLIQPKQVTIVGNVQGDGSQHSSLVIKT
ncbi:MAG: hypothetical protein ABIP97_00670 [Chthoniobacterales bacterium]